MTDFKIRAKLGSGAFGNVYLVQLEEPEPESLEADNTDNNSKSTVKNAKVKYQFAMKVMNKEDIFEKNMAGYAKSERDIFEMCKDCPFIAKMYFAFQNNKNVFLLLEFCYYGDLGGVLKRDRRFTEEVARKYLCQIIMAIEHLHSKNILYRDLKPDNILLGHNGNVKLTDFGLSKKDTDNYYSSKSFCGTLAYLAPEMFLETGYGKVIDWYCVGAVFYEFLVGSPPYYDSDFN